MTLNSSQTIRVILINHWLKFYFLIKQKTYKFQQYLLHQTQAKQKPSITNQKDINFQHDIRHRIDEYKKYKNKYDKQMRDIAHCLDLFFVLRAFSLSSSSLILSAVSENTVLMCFIW